MAGGTPAHADLAASITRVLGNALVGRCPVSSSDLNVRIDIVLLEFCLALCRHPARRPLGDGEKPIASIETRHQPRERSVSPGAPFCFGSNRNISGRARQMNWLQGTSVHRAVNRYGHRGVRGHCRLSPPRPTRNS